MLKSFGEVSSGTAAFDGIGFFCYLRTCPLVQTENEIYYFLPLRNQIPITTGKILENLETLLLCLSHNHRKIMLTM